MAKFETSAKVVINLEGGLSKDPTDYGGVTKYGIAKKYYPEVDIENLTLEAALVIYKRDYWDKFLGDKIADQDIATEMLDIAINLHWLRAGKFLQEALNNISKVAPLIVDGLVGEKTLAALNYLSGNQNKKRGILVQLNGFQFMHYYEQKQKDPNQVNKFEGWLRRVEF